MKKLTPDFIKKQGFKQVGTTCEDEFHYDEYVKTGYPLTVYFNFYNDGKETCDVEIYGHELKNVGEDELIMLLKIL